MKPQVHVIILNWNGKDDTIACVESLRSNTYMPTEIVLVDNGSTNDSVAVLRERFPDVTLLETGGNRGYAGGNNFGIDYAMQNGTDYLFVLNNDTKVDPDCIARMVEAGEANPKIGILGCYVYAYEPPHRFLYAGIRTWKDLRVARMGWLFGEEVANNLDGTEPVVVDSAHGCGFMVKREVMEKLKGFDEGFFAVHEELDFCMCAREAGYEIVTVPSARIQHKEAASFGGRSPARYYYEERNMVHYYSRRATAKGVRLPFLFWITYLLRASRRVVRLSFSGQRPHASAVVQGVWHGIQRRTGIRPS